MLRKPKVRIAGYNQRFFSLVNFHTKTLTKAGGLQFQGVRGDAVVGYQDLSVKYSVSVETARKTYHHAVQIIYKLLRDLDEGKRDLSYWKKLPNEKTEGMRQDVKIFFMHYIFNLRPAEILKILNIKSLSYVLRQIRKVAGQLKAGEISLIETTPEEKKAA